MSDRLKGSGDALPRAALSWLEAAERRGGGQLVAAARAEAAARVRTDGFPKPKDESWRQTPLDALLSVPFARALHDGEAAEGPWDLPPADPDEVRVVLAAGRIPEKAPALPGGVRLAPLLASMADDADVARAFGSALSHLRTRPRTFADLNTALFPDGALLHLSGRVEKTIHLVIACTARPEPSACFPRILVLAEPHTEATIVESYVGEGEARPGSLCAAVTEVVLREDAILRHVRLEHEAPGSFHVSALCVRQEARSQYASHVQSTGGILSRLDLEVALDGEGAECNLYGLYVGSGEQLLDHHTSIDHLRPRGTSREAYRGILDGSARGVFDGRIDVHRDAQRTSAHQENRNLILSRRALAHTKPSLFIDADDVKCSHGATVGQLDEDALYYLRSRGLEEARARSVLTMAFARDVVDRVPILSYREPLCRAALARVGAEQEGAW